MGHRLAVGDVEKTTVTTAVTVTPPRFGELGKDPSSPIMVDLLTYSAALQSSGEGCFRLQTGIAGLFPAINEDNLRDIQNLVSLRP